jgi:hypothetical protein
VFSEPLKLKENVREVNMRFNKGGMFFIDKRENKRLSNKNK